MKEAIKIAVNYMVVGIIATVVVVAILTLFIAMPDILNWVSNYIGTTTTWVLFIFIVVAVIAYCIAE